MTPLRTAFQKEISDNIEYGEAILTMLKRKAERQLEVIAPAHSEEVVELWRSLLDMQSVQDKLGRERYRLSELKT
jgi:hypothetical protein